MNWKDKITNKDGELMVRRVQERGLWILNGDNIGDKNGEYT